MNNKIYPVGWSTLQGRIDIYSPKITRLHKLAYEGDSSARDKLRGISQLSTRLIREIHEIEGETILLDVNNPS